MTQLKGIAKPIFGHRFFVSLVLATALALSATAPTALAVAPFQLPKFDALVLKANGEPATQAGSHPFTASTEIEFPIVNEVDGERWPLYSVKDTTVDLPPGLVGDPYVVGTCLASTLQQGNGNLCPTDSEVGTVRILSGAFEEGSTEITSSSSIVYRPIYSLSRVRGHVATFGFNIAGTVIPINVSVRSGSDYGLRFEVQNSPLSLPLGNILLTFWGVPADHGHDPFRGRCMTGHGLPSGEPGCPLASGLERLPFLSLPTSCTGPQVTKAHVVTWEGVEGGGVSFSHDNTKPVPNPVGAEGCNSVDFSPGLEARPTTNVADSPSGLNVDLSVPQNFEPDGTATAHLRKAVLDLPEGLVINPSGANGLDSCGQGEIGVTSTAGASPVTFEPVPGECKPSSRIGTVEIDSSSLERPLFGGLYVATPHSNPFGSLLAVYLEGYDPISGFLVKLAGSAHLDPVTGRVTVTFDENPQLPFDHLKIKIAGGAAAPLRTPSVCGTFSTTSSLTPWSAPESGPPATPSDTYAIERGAAGGSCPTSEAERTHAPSFDAGTEAPLAGKDSPLIVNLRREDGSQQFSTVTLKPPAGLIGKLAGVSYCSEQAIAAARLRSGAAELAAPSCPAASEVGDVAVGAGAGPAPYYVHGKAYLTGPYKGAPVGLAVIVPAVAGPFDLGDVVVRAALQIDPVTTRITATSDAIPSILEGIPLDVRTVQIKLDRPEFTRNPTSCNPASFDGQLISTLGQPASLSSRFQVAECGRLGFEPKMQLLLRGGTTRRRHPALTAVLSTRPGEANLASVSVAMPSAEFLDQSNLDNICTRVQFAASNCPAASIYGEATVTTPILDQPLTGPVYLRSSSNKLPDLVPDLRGPASQPIKLEAAGRTDTVHGGLRSSFESLPDAPFSKLVLKLKGGKDGLLVNSRDICRTTYRATAKFGAQNGLRFEAHPALRAQCKSKKRKRAHRPHLRRASRRAVR